MPTAIALECVNKTYGSVKALDDFTLTVEEGTIFGLLGPNGAGKTTCVSVCTTLLPADSGTILLDGKPVTSMSKVIRQRIALMPQGKALDPMLNVEDNLRYYGKLAKGNNVTIAKRIKEVADIFGLESFLKRNIFALSGGQFRRAQLARAFIGLPRYVFLDEPTLGIDIQGKLDIWTAIREFVQSTKCTVLLTSNDMTEVEKTCDHVGFINRGRLLYTGHPSDIESDSTIRLQCKLKSVPSGELPPPPPGVQVSTADGTTLLLTLVGYGSHEITYLSALAEQYGIDSLIQQTASLTDLFTKFAGEEPS